MRNISIAIFLLILFVAGDGINLNIGNDTGPSRDDWEEFQKKHDKIYESELEDIKRMKTLKKNYLKIIAHNLQYLDGRQSYQLAMNIFGDWTNDEFKQRMNGFIQPETDDSPEELIRSIRQTLPESVDWREKGAVTEGYWCTCCWAFSADGTCEFNKSDIGATVTGYKTIAKGDENALQTAIATVGPISTGIDSSLDIFQFYSSGVYFDPQCSSTSLDHAVLLVGYGTNASQEYYIIKNSYGTDWGENGYMRIARNKKNMCGIATYASYPTV